MKQLKEIFYNCWMDLNISNFPQYHVSFILLCSFSFTIKLKKNPT